MGEEITKETKAPFNSAVDTLMRLSNIMKEINHINFVFPPRSPQKQEIHLNLVKEYYVNAVPLLKDKTNDYKEILDLEIKSRSSVKAGNQKISDIYDYDLDKKLKKHLINMQLSISKFLMPEGEEDEDDY